MPRPRVSTTYKAVHTNLVKDLGPASSHFCFSDDCLDYADQWAYMYDGDPELVDDQGRRYSTDPNCYRPMCHKHHKEFDNAHDPDRNPYGAGENNRNAKLTSADACKIRELYAGNVISQNEIAKQFGVSQSCVKSVVNGDTWRDA